MVRFRLESTHPEGVLLLCGAIAIGLYRSSSDVSLFGQSDPGLLAGIVVPPLAMVGGSTSFSRGAAAAWNRPRS
ncbi:hypothetical protein ACN20G_30900 (plasmid) [Streptomyces sp. BI20]|uniref:hypothetical protein n=1 Tax=Streptomyces sp. BI20 TaxID=3403460 RepID=UPI003C743B8B